MSPKDILRIYKAGRKRLVRRFGSFFPLVSAVIGLCIIFAFSVLFFMRVEGWSFVDSFYMVVITLSTVGFEEVHQLSERGMIYTACLIIMGVGGFAFIAGSVAQLLVEGKLQQMLGRRQVRLSIEKLKNHYIICGYGRIGRVVAGELDEAEVESVVIEKDPASLERLDDEERLYVAGDATEDDVLLNAGLMRAKSIIVALSSDAANVYLIITARQMNPSLHIVARANAESSVARLERAGADKVVMPHTIGGVRMAQSVLRPTVTTFVELAGRGKLNLQLEELQIRPNSELVDKNLIESDIRPRFNAIIIGIKKQTHEMMFNPSPTYVIKAWDTLLVVGDKENMRKLREII